MSAKWPVVRLGEVLARVKDEITVQDDLEYARLTIRLNGRGIVQRDRVAGHEIGTKKQFVARAGQLVLSKIDARNGAFGVLPGECDNAIITGNFWAFDADEERLLAPYVDYLTKTPMFVDFCIRASEGTTNRLYLQEDKFLAQEISLPPLAEQRRLVARIEELAAQVNVARTFRQQAMEEAEALSKSMLNHRLTAAAKKYGAQPMRKVAQCAAGFGFPKQYQGRIGLKYPFAKVSDMNLPGNQRAITTAQNWVDDDDARELRLKIYPVGTIIFPKIGGAIATNKRRVLALPATFDNNVMGLIPSDKVLSEYLFAFMQSFDLAELQAGTSVPAVSQGKVEAMEIPVPPIAEQRRIVSELDALQAQADALKRLQAETAAELDALLPSILDKVFKGEL